MPETKSGTYTGDWYDKRNERRKEEYHSNAEYRGKANKDAREGYRKAANVQTPFDPRTNLDKLDSLCKLRLTESDTGAAEIRTFTKAELAEALGRPVKQVQQWAADGRLPATVLRAKIEGAERNWLDVYTMADVRAIIESIGEFLSDMIYYRKDHVDAIKAVYEAVEKVRGN